MLLPIPGVTFDFASLSFHVPICGFAAKHAAILLALSRRQGMSQVQAQTKDLALLWRFAQPPLRYRRPKRILVIRERTPPSVWFGGRVQLPAEVSLRKRITPRGFPGKPQMSDEPRLQLESGSVSL